MRICVIFNPNARGGKARRFRRHLDDLDKGCTLRPTTNAGEGRALAAEAACQEFDVIVAAGGDGTLNEVLNGIGDVPDGFARTRLAVLPLGTANCFARELRLPLDWQKAWHVIRRGKELSIDLPRAEFVQGGRIEQRYFAQLAGAGVDARAVELVDWGMKQKSGYLAYIIAGLKAVSETKPGISVTGLADAVIGEQVVIGNGKFYGGPFALFPDASLRDGLLDYCVLPRATWRAVIACAWGVLTKRLHRAAGMKHFRLEALALTASARTPLELDGELAGELPATFSVQHQALRVIVS